MGLWGKKQNSLPCKKSLRTRAVLFQLHIIKTIFRKNLHFNFLTRIKSKSLYSGMRIMLSTPSAGLQAELWHISVNKITGTEMAPLHWQRRFI